MKRIDTINARANMFGVGKSGFHDNADLPGQDATYVSPEWFNTVQEELCNLLELRGITLDPASKRQLYDLLTTQADLEALADEIETNFIRKNQIVDDLTTGEATKPVSARQAKVLKDLFDDLDFALLKGETGRQKLPSGLFFQWFTLNLTPSGIFYTNIATLPVAFTESLYAVMAMPMTLHNGDVLTGTGPISVVGADTYTKTSFRYRIDTNVSAGLSGNHKIKFYCVGV